MIDGIEVYVQRPSSLQVQPHTYSTYKSGNAVKALVGVDANGALMYVSQLYQGYISDKQLIRRSGFLEVLKYKIEISEIRYGDAIMADKGFNIDDELDELGIKLNQPPYRERQVQFSAEDVMRTRDIAVHRIHVERAIGKVKTFRIFHGKLPISLMGSINQIWTVCCLLTNFMPPLLKPG